jgi:hypothetical protein
VLDTRPTLARDDWVNRVRLFEQALALPEADRLDLAAELLASAPPEGVLRDGSAALAKVVEERIESVRGDEAHFRAGGVGKAAAPARWMTIGFHPDALTEIERARDWYDEKRRGLGGELVARRRRGYWRARVGRR